MLAAAAENFDRSFFPLPLFLSVLSFIYCFFILVSFVSYHL